MSSNLERVQEEIDAIVSSTNAKRHGQLKRAKRQVRKALQRKRISYETKRGAGYRIFASGSDIALDISFRLSKGHVQVLVNEADIDASAMPVIEHDEGVPFEISSMDDLEFATEVSNLLSQQGIEFQPFGGSRWMLWSIPFIKDQNHTPESIVPLLLKRAKDLDISYTYHTVHQKPYPCIGLGPV